MSKTESLLIAIQKKGSKKVKTTELTRMSVDIANQAILDKGYSVFDFEIMEEYKRGGVKVTRKSQNITIFYKNSEKEWLRSFQNDLDLYSFG